MLRPNTRWRSADVHQDHVEALTQSLHISPLIARLLVVRGLTDPVQARRFLYGDANDFHDPFQLSGMGVAVPRIQKAIKDREKIRIYGDYDADGVSSTALMTRLLRKLDAQFDYYVPNRFTEGYGLNLPAIDKAKEEGIGLIITVDTGISAVEQVRYAREHGIDVIVTDHHEPPEVLPEAMAVINPKKPGCTYPFPMLAGVGVAFKVAHALLGRLPKEWYEIAAIGTVADLVPLVDENRLIVRYGLAQMSRTTLPGLQSMFPLIGVKDHQVSVGHIGFGIGPRINAGGRLETADQAIRLLTTDNLQDAEELATHLDLLNKERQRLVEDMTQEAIEMWEQMRNREGENAFIVLAKEGWNVGVVGIVASWLVEKYYRPTIVLSIDTSKGIAKGSARSIEGFDLYKALTACSDVLTHYGGHAMAAGMTLAADDIDSFRGMVNDLAKRQLSKEDYIPLTRVDAECSIDEVDIGLLEQLETMAPFGMGNPSPRWRLRNVKVTGLRAIGKQRNHLKLSLSGQRKQMDAIGFHMGETSNHLAIHSEAELVGELQLNEWNGMKRPQFVIHDIAVHYLQVHDRRSERDKLAFYTDSVGQSLSILVFDRSTWENAGLKKEWGGEVYYVDQAGDVCRINGEELDAATAASTATQLAVLDTPRNLSIWNKGLKHFKHLEHLYCCFSTTDRSIPATVPDRLHFGKVYHALRQAGKHTIEGQSLARLSERAGVSQGMIQLMLDVFCELGLTTQEGNTVRVVPAPVKRGLEESALLQRHKEQLEVRRVLVQSTTEQLVEYVRKQSGTL